MLTIIDVLTVQHTTLLAVFKQLEQVLPGLDRLAEVKACAGMVENLLREHGDMEENLLYYAFDQALENIGNLEKMSHEHGEMDSRFGQIAKSTDTQEARRLLLGVMAFSRKHFCHEECSVFPLIREHLSESALKALGAAWHAKHVLAHASMAGEEA